MPIEGKPQETCPTCDGEGEYDTEPYCGSGCGCQGRMCGFRSVVCEDCEGTGRIDSDWREPFALDEATIADMRWHAMHEDGEI